jgi:hypothetical protein
MKSILSTGLIIILAQILSVSADSLKTIKTSPKKNLDSGVETKTVKTPTPIIKTKNNVDKAITGETQHPLAKTVNTVKEKPTDLDLSIQKLLAAEKEKSALMDHIDLDSGSDDLEQEKKAKEEGENEKLKMFLYQRRKFEMDDNLLINLNFGFDLDKKVSWKVLPFHVDLGFDKVLINLNNGDCQENMQCTKVNKGIRNTGSYNSKGYSYYDGLSFLGVQRIRPGELSRDEDHNLDHFFTLPMRFYDNNEDLSQHILGLGPNSDVWKYWADIYNFPSGNINLTLCYYKHHEYILFDSKIDFDNEIILKVPKKSDVYMFQGNLQFNDKVIGKELKNDQIVNLCLGNEEGLTMKVTPSIMELLKTSLCKNVEDCSEESDLKDSDMEFTLKFEDFQKENSFFAARFFKNSFVEVHKGELHWKVELINERKNKQNCQIILEQEFLREKYLMISYDLKNPDSLFIGFKIMRDSDFSKFDFYFYSIMLFIILTITMMVLFIILNYKINRFIEKEEKEKEKLLKEA